MNSEFTTSNFVAIVALIIITTFSIILGCIKNRKENKTYFACYTIIIVCTVYLVCIIVSPNSFLSQNWIMSLATGLYVSTIFTVIFTSYSNASANSITTEILRLLKEIAYNKDIPIKTYRKKSDESIIIDSEFYKDLFNGLRNSDIYYYEGNDAVTGTICLYDLMKRELIKQRMELYVALSSLNSYKLCSRGNRINDKECTQLADYMITLSIIDKLKNCQNLKIHLYIRDSQTSHHVHLTSKDLWYSPFVERTYNNQPKTYRYVNIGESEDSFYKNFKASIQFRFDSLEEIYIEKNVSLYCAICKKGLLNERIQTIIESIVKNKLNNSHVQDTEVVSYFSSQIDGRYSKYKKIIK